MKSSMVQVIVIVALAADETYYGYQLHTRSQVVEGDKYGRHALDRRKDIPVGESRSLSQAA
jgi:hypothetical protein